MPVAEFGLLGAAGSSIFGYNRSSFLFNRGQQVTRDLQILNYQVQKTNLYRQDVAEITNLTLSRTGQFHVVTALELAMCATMMGPGRIMSGATPEWLIWHQRATLCIAFSFLLASLWLSMRASLVAAAHNARLQLRHLRPVFPDFQVLDDVVARAEEFEQKEVASTILRVPFMADSSDVPKHASSTRSMPTKGQASVSSAPKIFCSSSFSADRAKRPSGDEQDLEAGGAIRSPRASPSASASADGSAGGARKGSEAVISPRHMQRCRLLQQTFAGCDVYCQLCMSTGTCYLLLSMVYYEISYNFYGFHSLVGCLASVLVLSAVVLSVLSTDHATGLCELLVVTGLLCVEPATILVRVLRDGSPMFAMQVLSCASHALFAIWLIRQGSVGKGQVLPKRFRPSAYLDVYGRTPAELERTGFAIAPATDGCESSVFKRLFEKKNESYEMPRGTPDRSAPEPTPAHKPVNIYNLLCVVSLLFQLSLSFQRFLDITPHEAHGPSPTTATTAFGVDFLATSHRWPLPRQPSFFRPTSLSCTGGPEGGPASNAASLPAALVASNSFQVLRLPAPAPGPEAVAAAEPAAVEAAAEARRLHCPVARHDGLLASKCDITGSCLAVVVADGRFWSCHTDFGVKAAEDTGRGVLPMAVLQEDVAAGQPALKHWAASDEKLSRIFAAPQHGPTLELELVLESADAGAPGKLVPVAALPLPMEFDNVHDTQWLALQVVNSTTLVGVASTGHGQILVMWDLGLGSLIASHRILTQPPDGLEHVVLCAHGSTLYSAAHVAKPSPSGAQALELAQWELPG